jgi:O-antigen/teichoic acid export membrane protein
LFLRRLISGAALISGANAVNIASAFLRGVLLARILGPDQYGVVVLLITAAAAIDLIVDAGVDQYLVRSRFGHRPEAVHAAERFRRFGSVGLALLFVLAAPWVSELTNIPGHVPELRAIAFVALVRSLASLQYKVQQRQGRFGKESALEVSRAVVDLFVTVSVAYATHSPWAIVAGAYANAIVFAGLSWILREPGEKRPGVGRFPKLIWHFSWPIYVNSIILFLALQGDRVVVANLFASADLARYAAASAIGQGVAAVLNRVTTVVLLPHFGKAVPTEQKRLWANWISLAAIAGSTVFLLGLSAIGPFAVGVLYGPHFTGLASIVFASACLQMIQIEQGWLTTVLVGEGATKRFPLITGLRAVSLPVAYLLARFVTRVELVPFAFSIGALASLIASYLVARPLRILPAWAFPVSVLRIVLSLAVVAVLLR